METTLSQDDTKDFLPALTIEEFRALPKSEQRRAIARDALEQIALGRLIASGGNYLLTSRFTENEMGMELRDVLLARPSCTVCGLGACFVSAVRLDDALLLNEPFGISEERSSMNPESGGFGDKLKEFFSPEQLDLIEAAFEETDTHLRVLDGVPYQYQYDDEESDERFQDRFEAYQRGDVARAIDFGKGYADERELLVAIMQRIADDEQGEFHP